ncbi:MAG TPA: hypothetical protein VE399_07995 [Gemmatimonadales bacterium]|nr:hypothetical protein [Gemmatimonadales bacterium]
MTPAQAYRFALIGGLVGLLSALRSTLFYALRFSDVPVSDDLRAQLAWAMLPWALQEIAVCAVLGAGLGMMVRRGVLRAEFRVLHFGLIGGLLALVPKLYGALLTSVYITPDISLRLTKSQLAWTMLLRAIPEIVVSAVLGAAVGVLVSRVRRSSDPAAVGGEDLSESNEQLMTERRSSFIISGLAITMFGLWAVPPVLLYTSSGVVAAWAVSHAMGWSSAAGILLLGGVVGNVAYQWLAFDQQLTLLSYFMRWGMLGIIAAILVASSLVVGPTLLLIGISPPGSRKRNPA